MTDLLTDYVVENACHGLYKNSVIYRNLVLGVTLDEILYIHLRVLL